MFLNSQSDEQVEKYISLLKAIGALSKLFSDAPEPYLAYRATENLFCKAFDAINHSRSDLSADASKSGIGIGLKTFLENNGRSLQKIAEFNAQRNEYDSLPTLEKIQKISELRNLRIETTKKILDLSNLIYHCITRQVGKINIYEIPINTININSIKIINENSSTIYFSDSIEEYSFNISKSTLFKRFVTPNLLKEFDVRIINDPYEHLGKFIAEAGPIFAPIKSQPHVFLPLYSTRRQKDGKKCVPEKSGLNFWNRPKRNINEIYIPVPQIIHKKFPNFFPDRETSFNLILPNRRTMSAKICQDNGKALMSNPNSQLGKWLLRDVLNIPEGQVVTYDNLLNIGLDSVVVYKIDYENYDIDFTKIDSFENFINATGNDNEMSSLDSEDEED